MKTLKSYFSGNYWNILDVICMVLFLIGGILMAAHHVDNARTGVYEAARVFLSLDIMVFTWRILQHLAIFKSTGPVLEMIYKMVSN